MNRLVAKELNDIIKNEKEVNLKIKKLNEEISQLEKLIEDKKQEINNYPTDTQIDEKFKTIFVPKLAKVYENILNKELNKTEITYFLHHIGRQKLYLTYLVNNIKVKVPSYVWLMSNCQNDKMWVCNNNAEDDDSDMYEWDIEDVNIKILSFDCGFIEFELRPNTEDFILILKGELNEWLGYKTTETEIINRFNFLLN